MEKNKKIISIFATLLMLAGLALSAITFADELDIDKVQIVEFNIIDAVNGSKVEHKKSTDSDYEEYKNNPDKFSNAVCQNQKDSKIQLEVKINYADNKVIKAGDKLEIPASYGGTMLDFSQNPIPLKNENDQVLGSWIYKNGKIIITFGGDLIDSGIVKSFKASFKTGQMLNYSASQTKKIEFGKKYIKQGKIGNMDVIVPFEYRYVKAEKIDETKKLVNKTSDETNDHSVVWRINLFNDFWTYTQDGRNYDYFALRMIKEGIYANPLTGIFVEDTFNNCVSAPVFKASYAWFTGFTQDDKVVEGWYGTNATSIFTKVEQGDKSRADVKFSLENGQYCIYDNGDGTYTFMLKTWDMNDANGFKYDDLPQVKAKGGVGSFLKATYPDIYGDFSDELIEEINKFYEGKAVQNYDIRIEAKYVPVKEITPVTNQASIFTNQTGLNTYEKTTKLTPPSSIAEVPNDPSTIKLIKADKDTGATLSGGFKFNLESSTDNGAAWSKVNVLPDQVEKGSLDADGSLAPDNDGIVQVKGLMAGPIYRFLETEHPTEYGDVNEDDANPNDINHPGSSNSRIVKLEATGGGHVVVMYNLKKIVPVKIKIEGKKELTGRELIPGEFRFDLYSKIGTKIEPQLVNGENGKFEIELEFDSIGVYEYFFREVNDHKAGMEYDETDKPVKIEVTKDNAGKLKAEIISEAVVFRNKFTPENAKYKISVGKEITGKDIADYANKFSFMLETSDPRVTINNAMATNDAYGLVEFDEIEFKQPGDYIFRVKEIRGNEQGIEYDESVKTVNVSVELNGATLKARMVGDIQVFNNVFKATPKPTPTPTPTPTEKPTPTPTPISTATPKPTPEKPIDPPVSYDTIRVPLQAVKKLAGGKLKGGEFSFELYRGNTYIETKTNDANGVVSFTDRTFSRTGKFTYTIKEVAGSNSKISYDAAVYKVIMKISDVGGKLKAEVSIEKDGVPYDGRVEFVNKVNVPKTGDSFTLLPLYIAVLAIVSLAGVTVILKKRESRQ